MEAASSVVPHATCSDAQQASLRKLSLLTKVEPIGPDDKLGFSVARRHSNDAHDSGRGNGFVALNGLKVLHDLDPILPVSFTNGHHHTLPRDATSQRTLRRHMDELFAAEIRPVRV